MNRRNFIQKTAAGAVGLMGLNALSPLGLKALTNAPELTITKIDTVRFSKELKIGGAGVQWISEGKKISEIANTYYVPTMMHSAGEPIL